MPDFDVFSLLKIRKRKSRSHGIRKKGNGKRKKSAVKISNISLKDKCTTTELSKLLTSSLTAVKNHVIRYCEKVYERSGKTLFWSIINSGEVLNKLKSRGFRANNLSTYDFS